MSPEEISFLAMQILSKRPIEKSLYVYIRAILKDRLAHLKEVFPASTNHAVAIKANSHPEVLREVVKNDCGLEAASIEEVRLAVEAGCPFEKIVFDSPVKTVAEIKECAQEYPGLIINANCFKELHRLFNLKSLRIGIRINPMVDPGSPGIYNVSGAGSKFGIPIDQKYRIVEYALGMVNVLGLHIHAGSEIGSMENHIEAIAKVVSLAEEVRARGKKLSFIDIGGGVTASTESMEPFFKALVARAPKILDYQIITEYGRFVQTHCAFVLSKVEYVLDHSTPEIALIHVGADLFPREIYSSPPPKHDYLVLSPEGSLKEGGPKQYDIGGPLCFTGDFLTRNIALPTIEAEDYVVITDAGANSLSMWSRHCSREVVEVILI